MDLDGKRVDARPEVGEREGNRPVDDTFRVYRTRRERFVRHRAGREQRGTRDLDTIEIVARRIVHHVAERKFRKGHRAVIREGRSEIVGDPPLLKAE